MAYRLQDLKLDWDTPFRKDPIELFQRVYGQPNSDELPNPIRKHQLPVEGDIVEFRGGPRDEVIGLCTGEGYIPANKRGQFTGMYDSMPGSLGFLAFNCGSIDSLQWRILGKYPKKAMGDVEILVGVSEDRRAEMYPNEGYRNDGPSTYNNLASRVERAATDILYHNTMLFALVHCAKRPIQRLLEEAYGLVRKRII
ncbi:MAG: hypothetical protein KKC75_05195 [Nanoarchaeota archaeon]|nr:hypothetical protein [Nanoarchaeota archaeon]MBU1004849.1 hypothetical protein [Nanoarchaeota archaeon]MBU1946787.1 hypothetical protein [Nanoarchaeota archaeon]